MKRLRRWNLILVAMIVLFFFAIGLMLMAGCGVSPSSQKAALDVATLTPTLVTSTPQMLASATSTRTPSPRPTTPLPTSTSLPSSTSAPTRTTTRTFTPTLKPSATRRATRLPTAPPTSPPPLLPQFQPPFPEGWHKTVQFTPANVAPGQSYWRLVSAVFCDVPAKGHEKEETCPDYPGGMLDHTVYIAVLDENGGCAENVNVLHEMNTGERVPLVTKVQTYPWTSCATDYEWTMYGEGNAFWLADLPSDRIDGLVLNSPQLNWAENRAHVRYFLIFQRVKR